MNVTYLTHLLSNQYVKKTINSKNKKRVIVAQFLNYLSLIVFQSRLQIKSPSLITNLNFTNSLVKQKITHPINVRTIHFTAPQRLKTNTNVTSHHTSTKRGTLHEKLALISKAIIRYVNERENFFSVPTRLKPAAYELRLC